MEKLDGYPLVLGFLIPLRWALKRVGGQGGDPQPQPRCDPAFLLQLPHPRPPGTSPSSRP